ncbi:hypothetical protein ACFX2A_001062 [Malus domestica]
MGLLDISIIRMVSKLVLVLLLFHDVVVAKSSSTLQKQYPSCPDEERSALLRFKDSFIIDKSASRFADAYPKVSSWKPAEGENSTCCSWEGVNCDEKTGHVIGLDLGSSCLHGSINTNSSLFRLVHLQSSVFSGQHVSWTTTDTPTNHAKICSYNQQLYWRNLTVALQYENLLYLDLSRNNLSGMLPQCLGNFSDHLILLLLGKNSFHGIIPQTYNNRSSLRMIDLSHNKLQGQLPRSLANCVMLEYLVLSNNRVDDVFSIWLGTLLELKLLTMRHNGFYGVIGKSRKNVDFLKLRILDLAYNNFTGAVPSVFPDIIINKSAYMYTDIIYDVSGFTIANSVDYPLTIATKGLEQYYPKIREEFASFDISSNNFEGKIP